MAEVSEGIGVQERLRKNSESNGQSNKLLFDYGITAWSVVFWAQVYHAYSSSCRMVAEFKLNSLLPTYTHEWPVFGEV